MRCEVCGKCIPPENLKHEVCNRVCSAVCFDIMSKKWSTSECADEVESECEDNDMDNSKKNRLDNTDRIYVTKNNWDLRLWVFEHVPAKYFCQKGWLHLDYPEKDDFLVMAKNIGVMVGLLPEWREGEVISENEWKIHVGQVLDQCRLPGENYKVRTVVEIIHELLGMHKSP